MLISRNLLKNFIPRIKQVNEQRFFKAILSLGMEIETRYELPFDSKHFYVGQIKELEKIPNTHLTKCKIKNLSTKKNATIVCGAPKLVLSNYVLVADVGANVKGIKIAKRTIKGIDSEGMLCGYNDLTIDGFTLPANLDVEVINFSRSFKIKDLDLDDVIYDVSVPANRHELSSYLIFAAEISRILNISFNEKEFGQLLHLNIRPYAKKNSSLSSCCKALNYLHYDLKKNKRFFHQTTDWKTKICLLHHQIVPTNIALVDSLTLISLLTNCPIHVYDYKKLFGPASVMLLDHKRDFVDLNHKTHHLQVGDIVIGDKKGYISLPGIIGSLDSCFDENSEEILIEVGNFTYFMVRNLALRLNVSTLAAKQASKAISTYMTIMTVFLVQKLFNFKELHKSFQNEIVWNTNGFKLDQKIFKLFVNNKISFPKIKNFLTKNNYFRCKGTTFFQPPWRIDLNCQQDYIEEIIKHFGLNSLSHRPITDSLLPFPKQNKYDKIDQIKNLMINNYFNQVKTYNMTNKNNLDKMNLFDYHDHVEIQTNNTNRKFLRSNLLDNMLKVYQYNQNYKNDLLPIFEIQRIFQKTHRHTNLTCLAPVNYSLDDLSHSKLVFNLNFFREIVERLSQMFACKVAFEKCSEQKYFYQNECLKIICCQETIGYIGKIKQSVLNAYDLTNTKCYTLCINIDCFLMNKNKQIYQIAPIGQFQTNYKDINLTIDLNKQKEIDINIFLDKIANFEFIQSVSVVDYFSKNNEVVYTIRYYLNDNQVYTSQQLQEINDKVKEIMTI